MLYILCVVGPLPADEAFRAVGNLIAEKGRKLTKRKKTTTVRAQIPPRRI